MEFLSTSRDPATAEKQMQNAMFEVKDAELDVDAKTGRFRLVLRVAV